MKKIMLGTSDAWLMSRSSHRPSVLYWRLSDLKYVTSHFWVKLFSAVFNFSNILLKFLVARGLSVFLEIFCPFVYLKNMPCLASVLENVYVKVSSSKAWISAQVIVFAVLWISIFSLWVQSGSKYSTMY